MDEFYSVAIPEPTTILGIRLRPLSLGHLVILHRLRSCFVTPGEEFTIHDLALSVLVCSLTYQEGLELFNRPNLDRLFRRWHRKLTRQGLGTWLKLRKPASVDYSAKAEEFAAYLKRHSTGPHYEYDPAQAVPMSCPTVQLVRVVIMQAFGMPEAEIMDRSWALCLWDYVTLKAIAGNVKMSDRESIVEAQRVANEIAAKLRRDA